MEEADTAAKTAASDSSSSHSDRPAFPPMDSKSTDKNPSNNDSPSPAANTAAPDSSFSHKDSEDEALQRFEILSLDSDEDAKSIDTNPSNNDSPSSAANTATSDSSSSHSDFDDEALQRFEILSLESRLRFHSSDFDLHVKYIRALGKLGEVKKLRRAREVMSAMFLLSASLWEDMLKDEISLSSSSQLEAVSEIERLFDRAVNDCLSVPLWCGYLNFILEHDSSVRERSVDGLAKARTLFERALTAAGLHFSEASKIWNAYLEFEQAIFHAIDESDTELKEKQLQRIRSIFHRKLSVPLAGMNSDLRAYKAWEVEQGNILDVDSDDLSSVSPDVVSTYRKALKLHDALVDMEEDISRAGVSELERLSSFMLTCGLCLKTFPEKGIHAAACGHPFCSTCWRGYVSVAVNDGPRCPMLNCPDQNCNAAVGEDMVKRVASEDDSRKYAGYFLRSCAEGNSKVKWCPAAGCDYAVEFEHGTGSSYSDTDQRLQKAEVESLQKEVVRLQKEAAERQEADKQRQEADKQRLQKEEEDRQRLQKEEADKQRLQEEVDKLKKEEVEKLKKEVVRLQEEATDRQRRERREEEEATDRQKKEVVRLQKEAAERQEADKQRLQKEEEDRQRLQKEEADKQRLQEEVDKLKEEVEKLKKEVVQLQEEATDRQRRERQEIQEEEEARPERQRQQEEADRREKGRLREEGAREERQRLRDADTQERQKIEEEGGRLEWDSKFRHWLRGIPCNTEKRSRVVLVGGSLLTLIVIWTIFLIDCLKNGFKHEGLVASAVASVLPGWFCISAGVPYLWTKLYAKRLQMHYSTTMDVFSFVLSIALPYGTAYAKPSSVAVFIATCVSIIWAFTSEMAAGLRNEIALGFTVSSSCVNVGLGMWIGKGKDHFNLFYILIPLVLAAICNKMARRYKDDFFPYEKAESLAAARRLRILLQQVEKV